MSEISARGTLNVSFGEVCDRGKVREENQDSIRSASIPLGELFIVADGIGGYQGGATASRMVVEGFHAQLAARPAGYPPVDALMEACTATNTAIHDRANSGDPAYQRMGSTVVLALIQPGTNSEAEAWIGHVGDSRAYLIHRGQMRKVTDDHSAVQALLNRNLITEEEARNHPDASVLTRSLGHRPEVEIEIDHILLQAGDSLLLCSDGLWGYVNDADIATVATDPSLSVQTAARLLLDQALAAGGPDNIGIEFIRIEAGTGVILPSAPRMTQAAPAMLGAKPGAMPLPRSASRMNNKSRLELIAVALLLVGGGGYLACAAHWHLPPFHPSTPKPPDVHTIDTPAPLKDSHGAESQKGKQQTGKAPEHRPNDSHANQPTALPTAQPGTQPTDQNADQPQNPHQDQPQSQPGNPSSVPPPSPSPEQPHHLQRKIVVVGEVQQRRHLPAAPGEMEWALFSVTHENRPACASLAKDHTVMYHHSSETMAAVVKQYPDLKGHVEGRNVESHDLTPDIKAACGEEYDIVVILARKPGEQPSNPNPGPDSNDQARPTAEPKQKMRLSQPQP